MEAKDDGMENPFADTLLSLEWIASAMDAARRHTERRRNARAADADFGETPSFDGETG